MEAPDIAASLLFVGGAGVVAAIVLGSLMKIVRMPDRMIEGVMEGLILVAVIVAAAGAVFRVAGWLVG